MSDRPIQIGDWVVVVRWGPCGCGLGVTGIVERILLPDNLRRCAECKTPSSGLYTPCWFGNWQAPLEWLKRIPPLDELEDVKRDEEISA